LITGRIFQWLGKILADVNGLLFVIRTVTAAPLNEKLVQAVDFSRVEDVLIPLG
jgi:hypothetical protein